MKLFEKISLWWHNIFRKRRVAIIEPESGAERWYAHLSPVAMVMTAVAIVSIVFAMLLVFFSFRWVLQ